MGSISIQCPACLSKAKIHNFIEVTPQQRDLECSCSNLQCGHTFVSRTEFTRTVHPSDLPVDFQTEMLMSRMPDVPPVNQQIGLFGEDPGTAHQPVRDRSGFTIKCDKCLSDATIYSSSAHSPLLREHWCWCNNEECGHTFVSHTAFYKSITPTAFRYVAVPHPGLLSVAASVVALPVPVAAVPDEKEEKKGGKMNWIEADEKSAA